MRLSNRVAVITGAARGIGKKTAEAFVGARADVVVADLDAEAGQETANQLKKDGVRVTFIKVDVADTLSAKAMIEKTIEKFGKIDVLVNNAGLTADGFLIKMDEAQWDQVIAVNLKGTFNCARFAADAMVKAGSGVILNATSIVGRYGNIGQTNYAATKFGVIGLTKSWAKELGPQGIRVNAVAPGFTKTEMISSVPEKILDSIIKKTPLRRLGEAEDIAKAYLFLASDEASFINGEVLSVDGGLVL